MAAAASSQVRELFLAVSSEGFLVTNSKNALDQMPANVDKVFIFAPLVLYYANPVTREFCTHINNDCFATIVCSRPVR
jgi:hypothetical protein